MSTRTDFDVIRDREIKELLEVRSSPAISIYIPTEMAGPNTRKNSIELKNALQIAQKELEDCGVEESSIESVLAQAHSLVKSQDFWQHQGKSLALFLTKDQMWTFRLRERFSPLVVVGNSFHLKELLYAKERQQEVLVLELHEGSVALFYCSDEFYEEITPETTPRSLDAFLRLDDPESHLQHHTETPRVDGQRPAMFHGHGEGAREYADRLERYVKAIDDSIQPLLEAEVGPLILAGSKELAERFREKTSYRNIENTVLPADTGELRIGDLPKLIATHVTLGSDDSLESFDNAFEQNTSNDLASDEVKTVLSAASHGLVSELVVSHDSHVWGTVDVNRGAIEMHSEKQPGDRDLLDLITRAGVQTGVKIHLVSVEQNRSAVAATFHAPALDVEPTTSGVL